MPSLHPFVVLFDRIAALSITQPEKAVLWAIARHSDWTSGTGSFASPRRVAKETGLGDSTVRRALASLGCDALSDARCLGHANRCHHRGLIAIDWADQRFSWTLHLEERAVQAHFPEVTSASFATDHVANDERSG